MNKQIVDIKIFLTAPDNLGLSSHSQNVICYFLTQYSRCDLRNVWDESLSEVHSTGICSFLDICVCLFS